MVRNRKQENYQGHQSLPSGCMTVVIYPIGAVHSSE